MSISEPTRVPLVTEPRPRLRAARRHGVVWALAAIGACRTNLPEEAFYDGKGGAPAAASGGAAGASTLAGTAGSIGGTGGTDAPPNKGEAGSGGGGPAEGGSGGVSSHPPEVVELDCGSAPVSSEPFSRRALRAQAVDCALHRFCGFQNAATVLDARVRAYTSAPNAGTLEHAQSAWRRAMETWSEIETFQFGPLASRTMSAGKDQYRGEGLREFIYAWPSTARCRVEDQLAGRSFAKSGMDNVLISARGLYALEYLLFYPGTDTACAPASSTGTAWPSLDGDTLGTRKLEYAAAVADDLRARAESLTHTFAPDAGNFRQDFIDVEGYPSEQEAMNVLGWALLYIEREVKDWKLGVPAGYQASSPVNEPEAQYAPYGIEALRANLRGFRSIFQGCGADGRGLGFDDWLVEAGHGELATEIVEAWRNAQAAADRFGPLPQATPAELQSLYATVKVLTDLLKVDLFGTGSPLNLKLPGSVEGDTD